MTDWRDRIVEVKRMRVRDISGHELNPKNHPTNQQDAMRGMLGEVGKADVLRAYTGDDGKLKLWDGHLRQSLDPDQEWWVAITDLTEAEARLMLVAFDPIAALAEQDAEKLQALLHEVSVGDAALQQMLASMAEDAGIVPPDGEAGIDTPPEEDRKTLSDRFVVPPFSVLDARQGYWQERKRAWIALGIQSELGRGATEGNASPGGSPRPAATLDANGKTVRGDGVGKPLNRGGQSVKMALHNDPMQRKAAYDGEG